MTSPPPPSENPLGIEVQEVNGVRVVRFHHAKILSDRNVHEMGDRLLEAVDGVDVPRLVICFDGVHFLSSAAVGKLVTVLRRLKQRGGDLRLCNLAPPAFEVFRVAHLDDFFQIHPDLQSALSALA